MSAILQRTGAAEPQRAHAPAPLLRTLVLCDLVDSTALVERLGDRRAAELFRRHDRLARSLVHQYGGREIDKTDGFLMMFERPIQAVAFALDYQRGLQQLDEEPASALRARIGIHVGDVVAWDNAPEDIAKGAKPVEVEGLVKPITSRLMQLALPGQILLSGIAYQLAHRAQDELGDCAATALWRTHGRYRFKGLPDPIAGVRSRRGRHRAAEGAAVVQQGAPRSAVLAPSGDDGHRSAGRARAGRAAGLVSAAARARDRVRRSATGSSSAI